MTDATFRRGRRAVTAVPSDITDRFGSASAQPRIAQVYDPRRGWSDKHARELLTADLIAELKAGGITRVEARWRRKQALINLLTVRLP
jgi:hypothetical protein